MDNQWKFNECGMLLCNGHSGCRFENISNLHGLKIFENCNDPILMRPLSLCISSHTDVIFIQHCNSNKRNWMRCNARYCNYRLATFSSIKRPHDFEFFFFFSSRIEFSNSDGTIHGRRKCAIEYC